MTQRMLAKWTPQRETEELGIATFDMVWSDHYGKYRVFSIDEEYTEPSGKVCRIAMLFEEDMIYGRRSDISNHLRYIRGVRLQGDVYSYEHGLNERDILYVRKNDDCDIVLYGEFQPRLL